MPLFEFAGDIPGATTRRICSRSSSGYGGPYAFSGFIRDADAHGIARSWIVVVNDLGPC